MHSFTQPLAELRTLFRTRPAFRQVFLSDVISQLGDGGLLVAFPMLILDRTHDVTLTGLAFTGEILASGLMSPVAGYWADRLEQKRVMLLSNAARVVLLGLILVALGGGWPAPVFVALSLLLGATGSFFGPARAAFLRRVVSDAELERVIALEGTMGFLVRLVSPPLMGALLAVFPAALGVELDVVAYGLGMLLLTPRWVAGRRLVVEDGEAADWREGWRLILASPDLRGLLVMDTSLCIVGCAAFSTTIAFLDQVMHLPAHDNGWLLATTGVMGAIGTQLAGRLGHRRWTYAGLTSAIALTYILVPTAGSLPALLLMWAMRGLSIGALCVLIGQRIAQKAPPEVMGRVQAAWGLAVCLASATGAGATPFLLRTLGAAGCYSLFGALLTLLAVGLAAGARARTPELVEA